MKECLQPVQARAAKLLAQLQKERGPGSLGTPIKERPTTKTLLASPPELQLAFVRHVVGIIARLGARGKKPHGKHEWFRGNKVPRDGEKVAELLMRRRLPFTDEIFGEMLGQIAGMDFMTFAPVMDQLVRELEKRAAEGPLPERIRQAATRIADELMVRNWPEAVVRDSGFPRAADRKLAGRLERALTGPLDLS